MSDWQSTTYGEVATFKKGINYTSSDYGDSNDGLPFITIKCVRKGGGYSARGLKFYKGTFNKSDLLNEGDVIFSITDLTRAADIVGSPLKVPKFSGDKLALASMDMMRIAPVEEMCDRAFLYHRMMLEDVRLQMAKYAAGSTVLHLETKKVTEIRFDLPPLEQQQKIAKILSTVDNLIEKTQTLIDKYTAIKQGMMADLFTRGIDMTPGDTPNSKGSKLRPSVEDAPELYKQTELGWVPKEWEVCSLSSCLEFLDSKRIPLKQEDRADMQGHYRYFGASGVIDYVNDYIFDGEFILLGEDGENVLSRNVPLAFKVKGKIWVNNHAHIMVPANNSNIDYFTEYLESLNYENLVSGSAQPKITQNQLAGMLVRVPTLFEQAAIAEKLYSLNKKIEAEAAYLEKLSVQKKGLMQDLLTGKVRVV